MPRLNPQTDQERALLDALVWMASQYLEDNPSAPGELDTKCMSAGETTLELLEQYGLVDASPGYRFGEWTDLGERFLRGES